MLPFLVDLGALRLESYWVFVGLGLAAAIALWRSRREAMGLNRASDFWLLVNAAGLGVYLGGRLGYLALYESPGDFWHAAFSLGSGFTILGSLFGAAAAVLLFCRFTRAAPGPVADTIFMAAPAWHGLGRLGCLAAGCCHGRPTELACGLRYADPRSSVAAELLGVPLLPVPLFEAAGEAALLAVLWLGVRPLIDAGRLPAGSGAALFFVGYALLRLGVEPLRYKTVPGVSWAALGLIAVGLGLFWASSRPGSARA